MNKLMARIVAVVMAIAMLGTVSFAAEITEGNLVTNGSTEWAAQSTATVLAFATNDANATAPGSSDKIIAIYQGAAAEAASIAIDERLIESYSNVVVLFSGNDAVKDKAVISLAKVSGMILNTAFTWTNEGTVYQNVVHATAKFTVPAGKTITKYGFKFYSDENPTGFEMTETATINGAGEVTCDAVIFAVPVEKQATVKIDPIFE